MKIKISQVLKLYVANVMGNFVVKKRFYPHQVDKLLLVVLNNDNYFHKFYKGYTYPTT